MKYFTLQELCVTNTGLVNIPSWQAVDNLRALVNNVLDPLRSAWGKPIIVTSGYRSPEVNKAIGGVKTSQHLKGEAVDLDIGTVEDNKALFDFICASGFTFDQLILENKGQWVHISYNINKNRQQILHLDVKK